jgi:hypothetical protein
MQVTRFVAQTKSKGRMHVSEGLALQIVVFYLNDACIKETALSTLYQSQNSVLIAIEVELIFTWRTQCKSSAHTCNHPYL